METDWVGRRKESRARLVEIPAELPVSMQRGGWLIDHYSRRNNHTATMQIEVHRRVRYQPPVRRRFAEAFAASLAEMLSRYPGGWRQRGCDRPPL